MRYLSVVIFVISFISGILYFFVNMQDDTLKIGLLYSKTGTMKNEEKVLAQVLHYEVQKLNQQGGMLNNFIEIIEYDGASDEKEFAKGAEFLINRGVKTIFGTWTSASRKAVKQIVERENGLLFYPVQYEGFEESKNILYFGSIPNQQIKTAISYIKNNLGKKIYVVGSDYIYPRMIHVYIGELLGLINLELVGSKYIPLGGKSFKNVVEEIKTLKADVIINTLNGNSNTAFFKELKLQGISADNIPVISTSIDENSLKYMVDNLGVKTLNGHYIVGSYFNSIDNNLNKKLKKEYSKHLGKEFILTDAGFNMHLAFEFYKRAVVSKGTSEVQELLKEIEYDSMLSASGVSSFDGNNHMHKKSRIAKIKNGELNVIWSSDLLIKPKVFPSFKNKKFWIDKEQNLYKDWNNSWQSNEGGVL